MSNDATTVMALAAQREGWSETTQLELALRYIQNQGDNALFADWLTEHYAENQDLDGCDVEPTNSSGFDSLPDDYEVN